jgi:hypothetical protein
VLLLLVYNVINAFMAWQSKRNLSARDKRFSMIGLAAFHLQVVIGLILYFISPRVQFTAHTMSDGQMRFFTVEHVIGMFIAVILITMGHRRCKTGEFKGAFWYYLVTLIVVFASIPWPFRGFGHSWF